MIDLDEREKKLALQYFRATSYFKTMYLCAEDLKYLSYTLFCYFYYDLEYYRHINKREISKANIVAIKKTTAMSNIVAFFEQYHKDACEKLCEIFGSDEWKKFSNTVLIQEKRYY